MKDFEMSQEQLTELLNACKPTPVMAKESRRRNR